MKILGNFKEIRKNSNIRYISNVNKGIKPFLIDQLKSVYDKNNILFVLDNNNEINYYFKILTSYLNRNNILKLPSWDNTPYEEVSPSQNILNERFKSFNYENNTTDINNSFIVLTNIDAFLQLIPKKEHLKEDTFKLNVYDRFSLEKFNSNLHELGYEKVSIVLEPYEYAVRGGLLDVWPIGSEFPVRIDFFGDKVDSIKCFNPISQITVKNIKSIFLCSSFESPRSKKFNKNFTENYRSFFGPTANEELFIHKLKNGIRARRY